MFDLDGWREIFQSIGKNKLRTVLSGLTITFAILLFTIFCLKAHRNQFKLQIQKKFITYEII